MRAIRLAVWVWVVGASACSRPSQTAPAPSPEPPPAEPMPPPATPPVTPPATAAPPAPSATVARPGELTTTIASRRESLVAKGMGLPADEVGYYMDVQEARFRQTVGKSLRVLRRDDTVVLILPGSLSFQAGSTTLLADGRAPLAVMAQVIVAYRQTVVSVHGHTDSVGDDAANRRISEQRALAVARVLIASGVSPERIVVSGFGSTSPVASNATEEGRAANRRIEIEITPLHGAKRELPER